VEDLIRNQVKKYVVEGENNWLSEIDGRCFEEPIVQFASADDPLFKEYKKIIGEYHLTPQEAFELSFGAGSYRGGTVISVVFPINEKIRQSNGKQTIWPSKEWALLRTAEVKYSTDFTKFLINLLQSKGYRAVAPYHSELFKIVTETKGPSSNWSERHIAYAAGLGTFSINDAFITEKGIAVKLLSVVTELKLTPDRRKAKSHTQNCLLYSKGICGACIKRCPVNAISNAGHDKIKCVQYTYGEEAKKLAESYGGNPALGAGCGLCQTHVPCQSRNPMTSNLK
jgi:epoxyqueuosine reductase QueG